MNITKIEFSIGYSKPEFYSIMGKFFAEDRYKKEMPYMKNSDNTEWTLLFHENELAGFYAHEEKKDYTNVSSVYTVEKFRNNGIATQMIEDAVSRFKNIRIISNNDILIRILKKNGFVKKSSRGTYNVMERRINRD